MQSISDRRAWAGAEHCWQRYSKCELPIMSPFRIDQPLRFRAIPEQSAKPSDCFRQFLLFPSATSKAETGPLDAGFALGIFVRSFQICERNQHAST